MSFHDNTTLTASISSHASNNPPRASQHTDLAALPTRSNRLNRSNQTNRPYQPDSANRSTRVFNEDARTLSPESVSALTTVLMALGDTHYCAASLSHTENDALEQALGAGGAVPWSNAAAAADSIDYVQQKINEAILPLSCALCCVTKALGADVCK